MFSLLWMVELGEFWLLFWWMRVAIGLNMSSHKIIKVWPLANEHVRLGKKKRPWIMMSCCCLSNKLVTLHVFCSNYKNCWTTFFKISHEIHEKPSAQQGPTPSSPAHKDATCRYIWNVVGVFRWEIDPIWVQWIPIGGWREQHFFNGSPNGPFGVISMLHNCFP